MLLLLFFIVAIGRHIRIEHTDEGSLSSILEMNHLFPRIGNSIGKYKIEIDDVVRNDIILSSTNEILKDNVKTDVDLFIDSERYWLNIRCTTLINYIGIERYVRTCATRISYLTPEDLEDYRHGRLIYDPYVRDRYTNIISKVIVDSASGTINVSTIMDFKV